MEDWEQFFAEKSRRRAEIERRARQRSKIAAALVGTLIIAAIVATLLAR